MSKNPTILTDADGVLLDWAQAFDHWMETQHGHRKHPRSNELYSIGTRFGISGDLGFKRVCEFNNSTEILALRPLRDAAEYVQRLHSQGYVFHVITSISSEPRAHEFRLLNLKTIFGEAIEDLVCLDTGADKRQALSRYKDSGLFWIEDKISNANEGHSLGLKSILLDHDYNQTDGKLPYPRVKNWKEIHELITS
jgi:hypothetical protein